MNFIHLITTRFNVPTSVWTVTRDGAKPLSEEWMKDRFQIFRKYCLPSFKNQSNKNFIWLVFFDVNTPIEYQKEIEKIQKEFSLFHPIFVQNFEEMHQKALEIIPSFFTSETQFVISTDIDNDDLLHRDFVATVQEKYIPKHDLVIDLKRGLQLTKTSENTAIITVFYMVANPFISLVEEIKKVGMVMKEEHLKFRNYPNYTSFDSEPRFIQYIHSNNLVNNTESEAERLSDLDFSDYGIAKENHFKISKSEAAIFNIKRKWRILKKLLVKK
ncbi:glycosyltransferase [Kaistella jeonii]|uniref:Rhamnosyl transferase n=1 Tax=Kaistella jeonii TaxID=266749 RepID=A0A0C1FDM6_9FLAO|nr:glycosyltransferase [Kaistella jeonii]KIA89928.1 hypothetical protein OA86_04805 [Kaistella jeonii]SFB80878.1 Putative rhamnosyl transferase [Kaistella jeonii]VEI96180.1 Protein of uncharacterised function (DUF3118) [Kaistella jeonii]